MDLNETVEDGMRMEEIISGLGNALEAEENKEKMKRIKEKTKVKKYFDGVNESPIIGADDEHVTMRTPRRGGSYPLGGFATVQSLHGGGRSAKEVTILERLNQSLIEENQRNIRSQRREPRERKCKIVPYSRLEELKEFYGDRKRIDSLVKEELKSKSLNEDLKGQWAIEQFRSAARHLCVLKIVDGEIEMPEVLPIEEYREAYRQQSSKTITAMEELIQSRKRNKQIQSDAIEAIQLKRDWDEGKEGKSKLMALSELARSIQAESMAILDQEKSLEERLSKIIKESSNQRDEDEDAMAKLVEALSHLKKFLGELMRKVPFIESAVRWKGQDGYNRDPYEAGDLRRVMMNLNFHYRNDSGLAKITLLVSGLKDAQGSKTAAQHLLAKEDWLNTLKSVGIKTIEVEELVALATIALFNDHHREAFIECEAQLSQTVSSLEVRKGERSIEQKSMLTRVQAFVHNLDQKGVMGSRLRKSKFEDEDVKTVKMKPRDDKFRFRDAEEVLAVERSERMPKGAGVCHQWAAGECRFGDRCRFQHPGNINEKAQVGGKGVCHLWMAGGCRFGTNCRFQHPDVKQAAQPSCQPMGSQGSQGGNQLRRQGTINFVGVKSSYRGAQEEGEESANCVVQCGDEVRSATLVNHRGHSLGWDSMASINVVRKLEMLEDPKPLHGKCTVNGLGGEMEVTHEGMCPAFGLKMKYIDKGATPNLMSLATVLQEDKEGLQGIAIFTSEGAVRFKAYPQVLDEVQKIIDALVEADLIEGYAEVKNGVYVQSFGGDGCGDGKGKDDEACAVTSIYAGRVPLSTGEEVVGMLASAGVSEEALVRGVRNGTILGLPDCVNEFEVKKFFRRIGKDVDHLCAEIVHAPLVKPIDYQPDEASEPGEVMILDAADPSFSRMNGVKGPLRSIGGYRDVVVAVDKVSGVLEVMGRRTSKSPEKVVSAFIRKWMGRWGRLKIVKADKEFVTEAVQLVCDEFGIRLRQSVPGQHQRGTGEVEGAIRWLQDQGQSNMNRAVRMARAGEVEGFDEVGARRLWFHCIRLAVYAGWMKPCLHDPGKTRFEERFGRVFNLSEVVMLPFALPMVVRRRVGEADGRGSVSLYLGPSAVVKSGVLTYGVVSGRVQQKYSFVPREKLPTLEDLDVAAVTGELYGEVRRVAEGAYGGDDEGSHDGPEEPGDQEDDGKSIFDEDHRNEGDPHHDKDLYLDKCEERSGIHEEPFKKVRVAELSGRQHHQYNTRSKGTLLAICERPPKPTVPGNKKEAMEKREWQLAMKRELGKINAEDTIHELPCDDLGNPIFPENAIVMRMFEILDYKWKLDPETGEERWLEVIRAVVDGSTDTRKESVYAETPDRSILLMMISIGASIGELSLTGDAVRAYLNAEALDNNLVVVASKYMHDIPKFGVLNKGLYGTLKGALGWERWIDKRVVEEMEFVKCDVPRGVYVNVEEGGVTRLYRHSDDFRMSSKKEELLEKKSKTLSKLVRMSDWTECHRFLGMTIESFAPTGNFSDGGNVVALRCSEKIDAMEEKFGYLRETYNVKRRERFVPLPMDFIKGDGRMCGMDESLGTGGKKTYMSLVGTIGYLATTIRFDIRFAYMILARRLASPREWDLFVAVWTMEYLIRTKDLPLLLGGEGVNLEVICDASFAILDERRSVKAHLMRTNERSGAVYASASAIKNAVTSIWEAEVNAASDGVDTMLYGKNICKELRYPTGSQCKVLVDNEAAINWLNGNNIASTTKHVEARLYRIRHILKDGLINVEYVPSEENVADIFTKSLARGQFEILRSKLMGHSLIKGMKCEVRGVAAEVSGEIISCGEFSL